VGNDVKVLHVGVWLNYPRNKNWEFRLYQLLRRYLKVSFCPYPTFPPRREDYDVVFASHSMAVPLGYWLAKRFEAKFAAMILDVPEFRFSGKWAENLKRYLNTSPEQYKKQWEEILECCRKADLVIAISKTTAETLQKYGITDVVVNYLGVDVEVADQYLTKTRRRNFFLGIANCFDHKRVDFLVEFFNKTGKKYVHIGDGYMLPQLVKMAKPNVTLLGAVDERKKWKLLCRAKALVSASVHEGFFIPAAEALYAECPVIAYDLPVLREVYGNKIYYWRNEDELRDLLEKKLKADREYVIRKKLTLQTCAENIASLLEEIA